MDLIPYLSAVILISTVATILLAVISYAAFKIRDKRRPKVDPDERPQFFHRYRTGGEESDGFGDMALAGGAPEELAFEAHAYADPTRTAEPDELTEDAERDA